MVGNWRDDGGCGCVRGTGRMDVIRDEGYVMRDYDDYDTIQDTLTGVRHMINKAVILDIGEIWATR